MTPEDEAYFIKILDKLDSINAVLKEIQTEIKENNYYPINMADLTDDTIHYVGGIINADKKEE